MYKTLHRVIRQMLNQRGIYADKGYCMNPAKQAVAKRTCHLAAIKKNNMKEKNKDYDRWYSGL